MLKIEEDTFRIFQYPNFTHILFTDVAVKFYTVTFKRETTGRSSMKKDNGLMLLSN